MAGVLLLTPRTWFENLEKHLVELIVLVPKLIKVSYLNPSGRLVKLILVFVHGHIPRPICIFMMCLYEVSCL
jgi:hypothetical protein